ncbi:signal peptidase I [Ostreibacterium oceani]|uniref:Signal peptidase I n=1 Tax=Ostreibacterium oceani TaxID=2654998 RepID=A0A6N7EW35_9GAMM|nr:signal peptidase I [Ostreibacterium oceani]MPV85639.1 signal peptidase I [Ostreibacterium oceani]
MFDSLRQFFEPALIGLFLVAAICYAVYRMSFAKSIQQALKAADNQYAKPRDKKQKQAYRLAKMQALEAELNTGVKRKVYFFADLFWILLIVVGVRSFLYEPFVIPSRSMEPGLLVGDVLVVNKFSRGLRLPITNSRLTDGAPIARGDVLVFKYPKDPSQSYIKRVIGLPGDVVYYDNRRMTLNGEPVVLEKTNETQQQTVLNTAGQAVTVNYEVLNENLGGYSHTIQYSQYPPNQYRPREWRVPEGQYLVMGDNRDNSADGREFGFVDDSLVIGKAARVILNFDCFKGDGNCDRFFKKIW